MNIYSLTCTRDESLSKTTSNLLEYFNRCNIKSKILTGKDSIFEAYDKGIDSIGANFDDIIILCHDDIEILTDPKVFIHFLKEKLTKSDTGFVGIAGTKHLTRSAMWWDRETWQAGLHSGFVFHGDSLDDIHGTFFGPLGDTVVLDGVFLAATKKTLRSIQLKQPRSFEGKWDFYDIFYTFQAFHKKLKNYTVPIQIRHESIGDLAGRESWHKNKEAFITLFDKHLPATL